MNVSPFTSAIPRYVLPHWWVEAYEAAVRWLRSEASALDQGRRSGLIPAMTVVEMNALAALLESLQESLITGALTGGRLRVSPAEHRKNAGASDSRRRFAYEKTLQLLGSLRLYDPERGHGDVQPRFFANDVWALDGDGDETLELEPSALGRELILGYADAYADVLRFGAGEAEAGDYLGGMPPLHLWKSVWLELSGAEQAVLLRLERAAQWEFRWLSFDGVMAAPLEQIFEGIALPANRRGLRPWVRRLKVLERLGRKLVDHGWLASTETEGYLAFDERDGRRPGLGWRVSGVCLEQQRDPGYVAAAGRALAASHEREPGPLTAVLALGCNVDPQKAPAAVFERLNQSGTEAVEEAFVCNGNRVVPYRLLFCEWLLRSDPQHPLTLPESVRTALGPLVSAMTDGGDLVETYGHFCRFLRDNPEFVNSVKTQPRATLAATATKHDDGCRKMLEAVGRSLAEEGASSAALRTISPRLVESEASEPAPPTAEREDAAPSPGGEGKGPAPTGAKREASAQTGDHPTDERMRRIAAEELKKMCRDAPERYRELRKQYLESLDEPSRRLILDVESRMDAGRFEEQLKSRLIGFMVAHPGAWKSVDRRVK